MVRSVVFIYRPLIEVEVEWNVRSVPWESDMTDTASHKNELTVCISITFGDGVVQVLLKYVEILNDAVCLNQLTAVEHLAGLHCSHQRPPSRTVKTRQLRSFDTVHIFINNFSKICFNIIRPSSLIPPAFPTDVDRRICCSPCVLYALPNSNFLIKPKYPRPD
jgi:hypothetical protein